MSVRQVQSVLDELEQQIGAATSRAEAAEARATDAEVRAAALDEELEVRASESVRQVAGVVLDHEGNPSDFARIGLVRRSSIAAAFELPRALVPLRSDDWKFVAEARLLGGGPPLLLVFKSELERESFIDWLRLEASR